MLLTHLHALSRHVPEPTIAPGGVVAGSCAFVGRSPSRSALHAFYEEAQERCSTTARVLLLDDLNEQTGLGFGFLALHAIFLQALSENRTLLPSSSVLRGETWRWCDEGPKDYSCYFEPWSSGECARGVASDNNNGNDIVRWDAASLGQASLHARVVRLRMTDDPTQETVFRIYRSWMHCVPGIGRSWWWGATWDILLRFKPFVEKAALDFLSSHGVRLAGTTAAEPFVVVIIRHGGKHVEERLVTVHEYIKPLERLLSSTCLNGKHVLLVTETKRVVDNFTATCERKGWNCFYTDQRRMDLNIDPWNPSDPRNTHGAAQKQALFGGEKASFASKSAMLHHIGWHSILNLAVSQHASGLIGSFGSSWSALTLTMMHRQRNAPVLGCSLRPGWKNDNMYTRFTPEGPKGVQHVTAQCRRLMTPVCKGGELMYEGLGLTWHVNNRPLREGVIS